MQMTRPNIVIRTIGNRSLNCYEDIDSETLHHTIGGAVRRTRKINSDAKIWAECVGAWGDVEVEINGVLLDDSEVADLFDEFYSLEEEWKRAIDKATKSSPATHGVRKDDRCKP